MYLHVVAPVEVSPVVSSSFCLSPCTFLVEPQEDHVVWRVDNKYYCTDVHFTVCSSSCEPGSRWEAVLMLCDLSRVRTQWAGMGRVAAALTHVYTGLAS